LAISRAFSNAFLAQLLPSIATSIFLNICPDYPAMARYFTSWNAKHCTAYLHDISLRRPIIHMQAGYLEGKVGDLATTEMLVMDESSTVAEAVKAMKKNDVSSVLVSRKGSEGLAGIVTERDVLYRVVAENKGPFKTTLKEIMSTPLFMIDGSASVQKAVLLMRQKGIRRLPVTKRGEVVGMITLRAVVGNMPGKTVELVQLDAQPSRIACPYCGSSFESKQDLSKHVDRLHIGSGLLEGDLRKDDLRTL
jgi:signal-transduction protein with cAMP-binding, CBS, and nucleotidyltransferase domain